MSFNPPAASRSAIAGFTLIEAMIVLVALAIVAAIAYPSYLDYVRQSKRSAAKTALMDIAAAQERYFFSQRAYTSSLTAAPPTGLNYAGTYVHANGSLQAGSADAVYNITLTVDAAGCGGAPCFQLSAIPQGAQAGDGCGTYTFDSRRIKGAATTDCW